MKLKETRSKKKKKEHKMCLSKSVNCISWFIVMLGIAFLFNIIVVVESNRVPTIVIVNKCCRLNEHLSVNGECVMNENETSQKWWPLITMLLKQRFFLPHGEAPRFFRPREQHRPNCINAQFLFGDAKMSIFSNGSLYLSETNQLIDDDQYCVDKGAAIFCLPPSFTLSNDVDALTAPKTIVKIRKCCGSNAVYDKLLNTCKILNQYVKMFRQRSANSSSVINYVYGFPDCRKTAHFAIVEMLKESALDFSTGNIKLGSGRQFTWNEYCLERVIDNTNETGTVKVFTCVEDLSTIKASTTNMV